MNKRRVVVTGLGALTPVGNTVNDMFNSLLAGKNGIDFIKAFDTTNFRVKVAAEIKNLDFLDHFDAREIKRTDRTILITLIAAKEAMLNAGLTNETFDPYRFATYISSGVGGINTLYDETKVGLERGFNRISAHFTPNVISNMPAATVSINFGLKGPIIPIVTACAASTNAIGEAYRSIKDGYNDLAIAGGAESSINEIGIAGFSSIRALSASEDINRASIPFDAERSGFVMGEGAGLMILEEYEHAKNRGAKILAELVGYGSTSDAYHITAPSDDAEGIIRAIKDALAESKVEKHQIDYINAHGTSTKLNDKTETFALKQVFGNDINAISISSTKSMTGHMLGATGGVESVICVKSLMEDKVPPTINYLVKDEECDLDYTTNGFVDKKIEYAMNINLGFGGHNACLIFKKGE